MKSPETLVSEKGKSKESRKPALKDTLSQYTISEEFLSKSPNSQLAYLSDLNQFQRHCQEKNILNINQLNSENIANWINQMKNHNSLATAARRTVALKGFLNWAIIENVLQPEFSEELDKLPGFKVERPIAKILTNKQVKDLVALSLKQKSLREAALVQIALKTGAKTSEIVSLETDDVYTQVDDSKVAIEFRNLKKQDRKILLDEEGSEILKRYLVQRSPYLKLGKPLFTKEVMPTASQPLSRQGFWLILKDLGKQIGVADLNPAILRNTFAVNLTGSDQERAEILGVIPGTAKEIKKLLDGNNEINREEILEPKFKPASI